VKKYKIWIAIILIFFAVIECVVVRDSENIQIQNDRGQTDKSIELNKKDSIK
jgi:hypothetical protein